MTDSVLSSANYIIRLEYEPDTRACRPRARFPDEPQAGRYSSLQRELYHNLVVLGVVDLIHRRQHEPAIQEILAALPQGTPKQQTN
ncbi:MAG: hypothetical protein JSU95_08765 [Betaproteobacteria bacterium]|nr:MAG: hypothetical protein JSU95_08765 [Betaproteobacteria bacterium]